MTRDEWIGAFATQIGKEPPTPEQTEALLDLAAVAAHASERTAAPVACWLAGRTGRPLPELIELANAIEGA